MTSISSILKVLIVSLVVFSFAHSSQTQLNENAKYKTNSHKNLNNVITELADKLLIYNELNGDQEEIAVTSFVDLHQLNKTTHFGRTVSEAFFDELFTRGFNVSDFRGQETLAINKNGEYFLTRDIKLLNKDVVSGYVLVGTYSYFEGKMLINARIMDNKTGKIVASARSNYVTNDCRLTESCRKINIIAHGSNKAKKSRSQDLAIVDHDRYKQHYVTRKNQYEEKDHTESKENLKYCDESSVGRSSVAGCKEIPKLEKIHSKFDTQRGAHKKQTEVQTKTRHPLVNLIK